MQSALLPGWRKPLALFTTTAALVSLSSSLFAETLAGWNFENTTTAAGFQAATSGSQSRTASLNLSNVGSYLGNNPTNGNYGWFGGSGSSAALAIVGPANNNHYITFNLSMTGYQDLTLGFDTRGTSTGFNTGTWSYSTNGTTFTTLSGVNTATRTTSFSGRTVDFSSISALDGASTVYIRYTLSGADSTSSSGNNRLDNIVFSASQLAAANTSVLNAATAASVGRVMQGSSTTTNVAVTRTGTGDANYSTSTNNAIAPATGTISGASGSVAVGVNTTQTGAQTGTVTLTNTSNASDTAPNKTITVSGTVVADREIRGEVNGGKVFVDTTVSGTATITTHGDSDHYTNVTVNGTAVTQGDASVSAGATTVFNDANDTTTREVTGKFTQSGNGQILSVDLNVTGEGLAGENAKATASIRADVYQHASLVANTNEVLDDGGFVTVENEFSSDGGQRAAAVISSKTTTGAGWSSTDFEGSTTPGWIAESEQVTANVAFDRTNKLNGTHVGSLVVGFEDEAGIAGGGSLGTKTWALSTEISGNTAQAGVAQVATVMAGNSYAGFSTTLNGSAATEVALRAGIASATKDVSITFSDIIPGAKAGVANDADRIGAIVSLEGSGSDTIVLELSYSDAGILDESALALVWLADGSDTWTLATTGNTGAGSLAGAYAMSYDDFLAANGGVFNANMLGAYGVDIENNTVWAIVNHNSDFSIALNAVPEPTATGLLAVGSLLAVARRRRNER